MLADDLYRALRDVPVEGFRIHLESMSGSLCWTSDDPLLPDVYATPGWDGLPEGTIPLQGMDEGGNLVDLGSEEVRDWGSSPEAYRAAMEFVLRAVRERFGRPLRTYSVTAVGCEGQEFARDVRATDVASAAASLVEEVDETIRTISVEEVSTPPLRRV
jgi:hypothetical protein